MNSCADTLCQNSSMDACPSCASQLFTFLIGISIGIVCVYAHWLFFQEWDTETNKDLGKYSSREKEIWPMNSVDFRKGMQELLDLIVEYVHDPQKYAVLSDQQFGSVYKKLSKEIPFQGTSFESIMNDIRRIILPGLTHWNHPRFHAYYGTGFSYPDILAETFISGIATIPFAWIGSPSLIELEMTVINWFGKGIGLHKDMCFSSDPKLSKGGGIIGCSSSEMILVAVMVSRNRKLRQLIDQKDPNRRQKEAELLTKFVVYSNSEAHSSIEKACNIAILRFRGVIPDTPDFGLTGERLEMTIKEDIQNGLIPLYVHGSLGTTNTAAIDKLDELGKIAKKYDCWFHVDAAYGGCAMFCPEYRSLSKGIELVDSVNANLYKWPFCSAPISFFWCRHRHDVEDTFSIYPTYLKAKNDDVPAFRHWGIQLSRRALCLKAFFVMRIYGLEAIQRQIRQLVRVSKMFLFLVESDPRFVIVGKPVLSLFTFRVKADTMKESNLMTKGLSSYINNSRRIFVTHASPMGIDVIRINISYALSTDNDIIDSYRILSQLTTEYLEGIVDNAVNYGKFGQKIDMLP